MWLDVRIAGIVDAARNIRTYELENTDGTPLPAFTPGAHVKVRLPGEIVRRYSLAGDPSRTDRYRIGVLREEAGSGGSKFIHDNWRVGDPVEVSEPENHFPLADHQGEALLVAGGIGITPILSMAHACAERGVPHKLVYIASSPEAAAFTGELAALLPPDRLVLALSGRGSLASGLAAEIGDYRPGRQVYVCGPLELIHAVREAAGSWPHDAVRFESFATAVAEDAGSDSAFDVELASTGAVFRVEPGKSILETLERGGVKAPSLCREGYCGTCLVGVVEGVPDHRDTVLTQEEREANAEIALCCSRAKGSRILIDL